MAIPIEAPEGEVALGLGAVHLALGSISGYRDLRLVLKMAPMIHRNIDINANPTTRDHRRPNRSIPKKMKIEVATIWLISLRPVACVSGVYTIPKREVCDIP